MKESPQQPGNEALADKPTMGDKVFFI